MAEGANLGTGQIAVTVFVDGQEDVNALIASIEAGASKAKILGSAFSQLGGTVTSASSASKAAIDRLKGSLDLATASAGKAAGSADWQQARAAVKGIEKDVIGHIEALRKAEEQAAKTAKAQRELAAAQAEADRSAKAYAKTTETTVEALKREAATLGLSRTELMRYDIMKRDMTATQRAEALAAVNSIAAHEAQRASMTRTGMTAKETAFALRGIPAQFTDIFVSLQAGQNPMTVLLQQGGQLKDMFGGSVTGALKAMGGYVLSLVNPYTIAAAAATGLALAWNKGDNEARDFQKSLILTGNAAGVTSSQLMTLAATTAASTGATKGAAAEALTAIVMSGKVSKDSLGGVAEAAINMQRYTGKAIGDTVKDFAELANDPVAAIKRLNDTYHFLTPTIYDQIKALDEHGKHTEAVKLAQDTFAASQVDVAKKVYSNAGVIEKAWLAVKDAVLGAGSALAEIGRPKVDVERIKELNKEIAKLTKESGGKYTAEIDAKVRELARLNWTKDVTDRRANAKEADAIQTTAHTKWVDNEKNFIGTVAALEKELATIRSEGAKAGATPTEIQNRVNIATLNAMQGLYSAEESLRRSGQERFVEMEKQVASDRLTILNAEYASRSSLTKSQESVNLEILASAHAAGLVSDEAYWDGRRALQTGAMEAEWKAAENQAAKLKAAKLEQISLDTAKIDFEIEVRNERQIDQRDPAARKKIEAELFDLETKRLLLAAERETVEADTAGQLARQAKIETDKLALTKEQQAVVTSTNATMKAYTEDLDKQSKYRDIELESLKLAEPMRATFLQGKREELDLERKIAELDKLRVAAGKAEFTDAEKQGYRDKLAAAQANEANLNATKKAVAMQEAEWKKGWDETDKLAREVFAAWGENGANVAQKIGDTLKKALLSAIYEATLKPVVFQVYQAATGALGMSMPGGSAGVLGVAQQGYGAYNALSGSAASASYAVSGMGGQQGAMLAAQTADFGVSGTVATLEAGGASSFAATAATAMPYVAAALLVAQAAGLFDHKGGPKVGGSAGDYLSNKGDDRFYTPATADKDIASLLAASKTQYAAIASRFGSAQTVKFGFGYDTDPQGTANDRASYGVSIGGKSTRVQDLDLGRGNLQEGIASSLSRMLLTAFQQTDMGPVANALVAGLDPKTITDEMLTKVATSLSGAADLFAPALSPMEAAMNAARATSDGLATELSKVGMSGDVSTRGLKSAVLALDLTTTAGQDAARSMLALAPAVKAYEASLGEMFGITATSLQEGLFDAIKNSPDAATAGDAFAASVVGGLQDALLSSYTSQIGDMMFTGVITPLLQGILKGQTVAQIMADGFISTAVENLNKTAAAYKAVMDDPRVKEIFADLKTGSASVGAGLYQPGNYVAPAAKDTSATKDTSASDAAKNAEDLAKQMRDVAYAMATLNMLPLAKTLADVSKATDDAAASATKLGATEKDLSAIRDLGTAQAKKAVSDAGKAIFESLRDTAATLGMGQATASIYAAGKAYDTTIKSIDEFSASAGDLADPLAVAAGKADALAIKTKAVGDVMESVAKSLADAYVSLLTAQGRTDAARSVSLTGAQSGYAQAYKDTVAAAAKQFGVSVNDIEAIISQSGGFQAAAEKFGKMLDTSSSESLTRAAQYKTQIIDITTQMWSAQLDRVKEIQGWIEQTAAFSKGIDTAIFDIRYALPGVDQAGMLQQREASLWADFNSYDGPFSDETFQHQIDLAGKLQASILKRYDLEAAALEKTSSFIRDISDFSKSLKIGDLSPLVAVEKAVEARRQYSDLMRTLRDPLATSSAKDIAQGKITGAATDALKLLQSTSLTSIDYAREYALVQADMASLGADSLTVEEQQAAELKRITAKAAATIGELQKLQGIAAGASTGLGNVLKPEIAKLAGIGTALESLGATIGALPRAISDALAGITSASAPLISGGTTGNTAPGAASPDTYWVQSAAPSLSSLLSMAQSGDVLGALRQGAGSYTADQMAATWNAANPGNTVTAEQVRNAGIPGYATGINAGILPADTVLQAHGGEEITPARYVDRQREARDETNALLARLLNRIDALNTEVTRLKESAVRTEGHTKRTADITQKSDAIGPAPARETP